MPAAERTTYAVWEITLQCNLACVHCGSRAGTARSHELDTREALDLVRQLAAVGIAEVTLIGGEAYLRPDWLEIAAAVTSAGMACSLTTGGYGLSQETARRMEAARIRSVSVSVDGLEASHDRQRGKPGSWRRCFESMAHVRSAGMALACNTQLNRLSAPELPLLLECIKGAGVQAWQLQLTVPMGNAVDHAWLLLQPAELLDLYPMLADVVTRARRHGVRVFAGNNIGYYGPYETLLRGEGGRFRPWMGCHAGLNTLGIEADGTIKGCPSLPTATFTGGNIRQRPLHEIVRDAPELRFNLGGGTAAGTQHLWGFCAGCRFARLCRGGCTWTADAFFGRRGNNPYCHHRALELSRRGRRERVVLSRAAAPTPFATGEFSLIEEPLDAPWPEGDAHHFTAERVAWPQEES